MKTRLLAFSLLTVTTMTALVSASDYVFTPKPAQAWGCCGIFYIPECCPRPRR